MTTAHRPTWKAAVGRENEGGWSAGGAVSTQRSALAEPAHTKLKYRQPPQDEKSEMLRKSLLALEEAEKKLKHKLPMRELDPEVEDRAKKRLLKQTADVDEVKLREKYDDSDADDDSESDLDREDDSDDLDGDSSDSDDEAALQAELAKIREEREEAKRKAAEEAEVEETERQEEAALLGNPLLNSNALQGASGKTKRRWNDDVVFRNQAKGEPAPKKRFVNDTVRNDFHRRFLNKFIR